MTTAIVKLELTGLVAIHAARAAHTALTAIPNIVSAQVTMAGAVLDVTEPLHIDELTSDVRRVLEEVGVGVVSAVIVQKRTLPLA